jgi:hypothetical protein
MKINLAAIYFVYLAGRFARIRMGLSDGSFSELLLLSSKFSES